MSDLRSGAGLVEDADRVRAVLREQDVSRQTRTIAKLAGLSLDRTETALHLLDHDGYARRTDHGLWERAGDG